MPVMIRVSFSFRFAGKPFGIYSAALSLYGVLTTKRAAHGFQQTAEVRAQADHPLSHILPAAHSSQYPERA